MIQKKFRLSRPAMSGGGFRRAYSSPYFSIKVRPNAEEFNRFGVVISNKMVPTSVRRHFFKRALMDGMGVWRNAGTAWRDIICVASPEIKNISRAALKNEIEKAIKEII